MPPPTQSSPALPLNTAQSTLSTASSTTAGAAKSATSAPDISSPHELTAFSPLPSHHPRPTRTSHNPVSTVTQMSSRVDALEASIHDIISSDTPAPPLPPSLPQSPSIPQRKSTSSG
ncbi:hypothetical protein C8T65DRAFT_644578 [Cerioporus squamosus]|nr:hypothetical protein C8T65DRAFT_644578 [Cerioporus squamosus]